MQKVETRRGDELQYCNRREFQIRKIHKSQMNSN